VNRLAALGYSVKYNPYQRVQGRPNHDITMDGVVWDGVVHTIALWRLHHIRLSGLENKPEGR